MSDNHINNNKSYLIIILFFLLSIFIVPFASRDITFYFSSGKALHSGLNTYAQSWHISNYFVEAVQGSQDLVGFPYGPVMASVFKVVYSISGDNMVIFTIFWRLFIISLFILLSFLTYFLIRHYSKSHNKEIFYLFFLTQPLFLFEIVGSGHFDVFWIIFVLLAIIFAQYKKWWLVILSLIIGIWIKFVPVFMLPWFALWWWQDISIDNWKKPLWQAVVGVFFSFLVTILVWSKYWSGFGVFDILTRNNKWVTGSLFGVIYYGLEPIFKFFIGDNFHWLLTRFSHLLLFSILIYFVYPYIKNYILIFLRKKKWRNIDFIQAIFVTMLSYLFLWQKSFWPWYVIWLIPVGLIVFAETKKVFVKKILIWISLSPLSFYMVWIVNKFIVGSDAYGQNWFNFFSFFVIMLYPLIQLYKWRKQNYDI